MTLSASHRTLIGIIGSGATELPAKLKQFAYKAGQLVAGKGFVLLTGGRGGIMYHASRGASEAGGTVVGIIPGKDTQECNPFVDIPIITGISDARNLINILSARVVIAFPGGGGTLSEIGLALKNGVPIINCGDWRVENALFKPDAGLHTAVDIEAIERLLDQFCG
ncbi:MAG: TIGR00725 family protein [Candidatus Delongbacteria bacterium]|nr:TIGR00725 family protein [Candidatus Delongbacteria bacterium]